jgi:hypothetical protein
VTATEAVPFLGEATESAGAVLSLVVIYQSKISE